MNQKLRDKFKEGKLFKLVLGLGNQSQEQIKTCARIYANAGCDMFDINASESSIEALFEGIKKAGRKTQDFLLCISIGIEGDIHTKKALVNQKKCVCCEKCIKHCPQDAISIINGTACINEEKCIGCKKCKCTAISYFDKESDFDEAIRLAKKYDADCIELHISSKKSPIKEIKYLIKNSPCALSLCLDRKYYSNEKLSKLVEKVIKLNHSPEFIIQADGVPMSGSDNSLSSTLQAVAAAHLVQKYGTYILISGGTNSKTARLADSCDVRFNGVSIGSYARKIIKESKNPQSAANELVASVKNV